MSRATLFQERVEKMEGPCKQSDGRQRGGINLKYDKEAGKEVLKPAS
jgi:hypothetical protein